MRDEQPLTPLEQRLLASGDFVVNAYTQPVIAETAKRLARRFLLISDDIEIGNRPAKLFSITAQGRARLRGDQR